MMLLFKLLVTIVMLFCISLPASSWSESASTKVVAYLPTILSIDSVFIDDKKLSSAIKSPMLEVKDIASLEEGVNQLRLSSIQYTIKTNTYNPVQVIAQFISLSNGDYSFSPEKLSMDKQYTSDASLPKTSKLSPKFTPVVEVTSEVPPGNYNGTIILTISAL